MQGEFSLGELAVRFGLTLRGEPSLTVRSVATLSRANAGALSFLANSRYRRQLDSTQATAVLLSVEDESHCPVAALIDPNPYLAYARIAALLHPPVSEAPGIHPSAVVAGGARIAASASIGPLAVIEEDAQIAERVLIGPGCIVQRGARVGADSALLSRVNLYPGVTVGQRLWVGHVESGPGNVPLPQGVDKCVGIDVSPAGHVDKPSRVVHEAQLLRSDDSPCLGCQR